MCPHFKMLWNQFFSLTHIQKFPIRIEQTLKVLHFKIHAMQLQEGDCSLKCIH